MVEVDGLEGIVLRLEGNGLNSIPGPVILCQRDIIKNPRTVSHEEPEAEPRERMNIVRAPAVRLVPMHMRVMELCIEKIMTNVGVVGGLGLVVGLLGFGHPFWIVPLISPPFPKVASPFEESPELGQVPAGYHVMNHDHGRDSRTANTNIN